MISDIEQLFLNAGINLNESKNDYTDNSLEDLFNAFEGLLVTHTFNQEQIRRFLVEKGKELNEIYFKNETEN